MVVAAASRESPASIYIVEVYIGNPSYSENPRKPYETNLFFYENFNTCNIHNFKHFEPKKSKKRRVIFFKKNKQVLQLTYVNICNICYS